MIHYVRQEKEKDLAVDLIGGPGFDSRSSGMVYAPADQHNTHGKPWFAGTLPAV